MQFFIDFYFNNLFQFPMHFHFHSPLFRLKFILMVISFFRFEQLNFITKIIIAHVTLIIIFYKLKILFKINHYLLKVKLLFPKLLFTIFIL
jgi:hypothetical protein